VRLCLKQNEIKQDKTKQNKKVNIKTGMVEYAKNSRPQGAEALNHELKDSLGYVVRLAQKKYVYLV
jgi:patatin-like phospholipase/acyl hydrolase